jgi:hypothetical protein
VLHLIVGVDMRYTTSDDAVQFRKETASRRSIVLNRNPLEPVNDISTDHSRLNHSHRIRSPSLNRVLSGLDRSSV